MNFVKVCDTHPTWIPIDKIICIELHDAGDIEITLQDDVIVNTDLSIEELSQRLELSDVVSNLDSRNHGSTVSET